MTRARARGRGHSVVTDTRGNVRVEAEAVSVYTFDHGTAASDRRDESDGPDHSLHGRGAGAVAAGGAGIGPDRVGSGAPPAGRGDLTRIADALERLAGAQERIADALERGAEGAVIRGSKGSSAMSETVATTTPSEYVTQKNCVEVLGIHRRKFLELLRRDDAPQVVAMGKLRMVRRDEMIMYVGRLGAKVRGDEVEQDVDGADAVLREIGCAPVRR
ncbi:MAG: hypothetical protein U0353_27390 [Sandaracinus sp.]